MKREFPTVFAHMLLAALLCSLHHWAAMAKNRGDYSPFAVSPTVSSMTYDETHAYAPPAQRFMSLGQLPAEVDNYERRDSSAGNPFFLPAVILGGMGWVLGSLERAFIAADALFPALALGLLYAASAGLIRSLSFRLLLAWGTLLIPFGPRNFFWSGYDALLAPPDFTRTPQPEISFTFMLLALLLATHALQPSAKRGTVIAAGLVGALVACSYYFYALAWFVALGMLLVLTVIWSNWGLAKRIAIMLSVTIAASLPSIIAAGRGIDEGGRTYLLARMGSFTHTPRLVPLFCAVPGLLLFWKFGGRLFRGQEHQARIGMFVLVLLAGLLGLNFQVLSGYDAQHSHFWNRLILPVAFFLCGGWLLSVAESVTRDRRRAFHAAAVVILVCILLNAGARQAYVGTRIAGEQRASRPESELLMWARSNLPPGSVVGAVDPDLLLMIPAMGPNFTYVPSGLRSLTPTDEIVDRYYELASLLGLPAAEVEAIAASPGHVQASQLLAVLGCAGTPPMFSKGYLRYRQKQAARARRLDYVVSDPGKPIPARIAEQFVKARVLHINQRYQLISLR